MIRKKIIFSLIIGLDLVYITNTQAHLAGGMEMENELEHIFAEALAKRLGLTDYYVTDYGTLHDNKTGYWMEMSPEKVTPERLEALAAQWQRENQ